MIEHLQISNKVRSALKNKLPVVVVESTVWVHGLPKKEALRTLHECNSAITSRGAEPATALIHKGQIVVGASLDLIKHFIETGRCKKANLRDLPYLIANRQDGATTVSSTMFIAHLLGLPLCVTGGIGGVHRNANKTFDVSADLRALSDIPVALVSSGTKSILDVGATLENLETQGVPVLCYQTDTFPTFYSHESVFPAPERVNSIEEIAQVYRAQRALKMNQGLLIANPIPENYSLDYTWIDEITERATREAEEKRIEGKELTPFLLERLAQFTHGESLMANTVLLKHNAALAGELATYMFS